MTKRVRFAHGKREEVVEMTCRMMAFFTEEEEFLLAVRRCWN